MIKVNDEFVASHQIVSIGLHPTGKSVVFTLIGGREIHVKIEHGFDKYKALEMFAYRAEEDMLKYGGK